MAKKRYKRRKFVIDPLFQYRFVKKVTTMGVLVVVTAMLAMMVVLSLMKRQVSQPDPFSDDPSLSLASMPDLPWMLLHLWPYLILGIVLVVIMSFVFGLIESCRIAGPEYRMRCMLKLMAQGDFSSKQIRLRKGDELEKLYKAIMHNHGQWKSHILEMQKMCQMDADSDEKLKRLSDKVLSFKVEDS